VLGIFGAISSGPLLFEIRSLVPSGPALFAHFESSRGAGGVHIGVAFSCEFLKSLTSDTDFFCIFIPQHEDPTQRAAGPRFAAVILCLLNTPYRLRTIFSSRPSEQRGCFTARYLVYFLCSRSRLPASREYLQLTPRGGRRESYICSTMGRRNLRSFSLYYIVQFPEGLGFHLI
jgi:hypothetical protein